MKTWEVYRSGRHHLNIVLSPWRYIPQKLLSKKWLQLVGVPVLYVKRVATGISKEVAKSRRNNFGKYVSKFDQMPHTGRGVTYSKNWPKLPRDPAAPRRGEIHWGWIGGFSEEGRMHWYETELGHWKNVGAYEWACSEMEKCDCFDFGLNVRKIANDRVAAARAWIESRERERLSRDLGQNESAKLAHLHNIGLEVFGDG